MSARMVPSSVFLCIMVRGRDPSMVSLPCVVLVVVAPAALGNPAPFLGDVPVASLVVPIVDVSGWLTPSWPWAMVSNWDKSRVKAATT